MKIQSHTILWAVPAFIMTFLLWAYNFEMISVVPAKGIVVSEISKHVLSHKEGGVLKKINVAVGDSVSAGDTVLQVKNLFIVENAEKLTTKINELNAQIKRLESESLGKPFVANGISKLDFERENILYQKRKDAFLGKINVIEKRKTQKQNGIARLQKEINLLNKEISLHTLRQDKVRDLGNLGVVAKFEVVNGEINLVQINNRLNEANRRLEQEQGQINALTAEIAYEKNKYKADVQKELDNALLKRKEKRTELKTNHERANRQDIKTTVSGIVHKIFVETTGAAITANQRLVEIIPKHKKTLVEANLNVWNRDLVWVGMDSMIVPTNNQSLSLKPMHGKITKIGADAEFNEIDREFYFKVQIEITNPISTPNTPLKKSYDLFPGMQVSVRFGVGQRSVLDYLMRPFIKGADDILTEPLRG